jgi:Domain of unknown function (DUF4265)
MQSDTAVHLNPVWRERANFLIKAGLPPLAGEDDLNSKKWEQLWCKQVCENQFEICCIPFFVYDLALGDIVETGLEGETRYLLQRVIKPSGHNSFRVWFSGSSAHESHEDVVDAAARFGCLVEWSSTNLLAIDASSDSQAQAIADYLTQQEQNGSLVYETGRNS